MYNRYVPQTDGSYCRKLVNDSPQAEIKEPPCQNPPPVQAPGSRKESPGLGIGAFFRQLMPGGFSTEDLLVVILLLLMAGDCKEKQNSALLTLALYLFL